MGLNCEKDRSMMKGFTGGGGQGDTFGFLFFLRIEVALLWTI